jgi:hypothetical protein
MIGMVASIPLLPPSFYTIRRAVDTAEDVNIIFSRKDCFVNAVECS